MSATRLARLLAHPLWSSLLGGLLFALAGLLAAPLFDIEMEAVASDGGRLTWPILFIGVFLAGSLFWFLLMARRGRYSLRRGAVTGVMVACFSYPVVLSLVEILRSNWLGVSASAGEQAIHVLALSGLGLATTGFSSAIAFGLVGAMAAWLAARAQGPVQADQPPGSRKGGSLFRALTVLSLAIVAILVGTFAFMSLLPLRPLPPETLNPQTIATTHAEALAAFERVKAREAEEALHPRCGSLLLTHGERVEKAVVFFHGLTNCPAQADELAPMLFAAGYNVYVPRLPRHGEADPLTLALADLKAEEMAATAAQAIALAGGLGEEVVVLGLSAGGTITALVAQDGPAVADSISVAPFFGPNGVPGWAVHAATNLLLTLPNMMIWWDPENMAGDPNMDYAYPRFATHALAEVMRLGWIAEAGANARTPLNPRIAMLLNEADGSVNNALALRIVDAWRGRQRQVHLEWLPQEHALPHDLVDPRQPDGDIGFVYPLLHALITRTGN